MRPTYGDEARWFLERSELYKERAELRAENERLRDLLRRVDAKLSYGDLPSSMLDELEAEVTKQ